MSSSAVATVPPMMNMPTAPHDEEDHGAFLSYFIAAGAYVLKAKTVTLQVYDETINSPNCGGHGPKWQWKRKYLWVEPENDTLYIADAPADAATQPIPLRLCRRAEPITRFVASKLSIPSTLAKSLVSSTSEMSTLSPSNNNGGGGGSTTPPQQPHWIIRTADKVFCFQSTTDAEAQQWVAGLNAVFPAMRALGGGGGGAPSAPTTARGTRTTTTLLPSVDVRDVSNSSYPPTAASSPNGLRSGSSATASPISSSPNQQQQQQHSPPSSAGAFAANNNNANRSSGSGSGDSAGGAILRGADPLAADESMPYFESTDNQTANSTNQQPQQNDDFSKQVRNTSFGDFVQTSATGKRGAASRTTSRRTSGGGIAEGGDESNGDDSECEFNQTYGGEGYRSATNRQQHNNNSLYGGKPYMMRNTFYFRDPADAAYLRTQSGLYGNNNSSFQRQSFVADTARSSRRGSDAAAGADAFEVRRTESTVSAATLRKRSQNLAIQSTNNNNNASLASAPTFPNNNNTTFNNNNSSLSAAAATYNAVLERAQEEERNQLLAKSSKPTKFGYVGDSAHARAAADDAISACRMGMWMVKGKSAFQTGTGTLLDEVAEDEARGLDGTIGGGGDAFDEDRNSTFVDPYGDTPADARPSHGGSRRGSGVVAVDESSSAGGSSNKQRLTTIANKLGVGAQWKKKFLWIDGREICYGNAKGKRETTFFIDEVRDAYRLALHEMEKVKAPDANKRFGWCMRLRNGRIIYFGGESDTTVNSWVIALNYLRPETPEEVHSREQLEHERALLEDERRRAWEHRMAILKAAEDARRAEVERRRKEEEQRKMQELVRVMFEAKAKIDEQIRKEREEKERREKEERETGSHLHLHAAAAPAPAEDAEAARLREEQLRRQKALELQHEKLMQDYMEECHKPVSPIRTNRREGKENSGSCCSIQ